MVLLQASSASRIRSLLAILVITLLLCAVDAGTGKRRHRKSKPETDEKTSSRKKEKESSKKYKRSNGTQAPSLALSTTGGESHSLLPSSTVTMAPSISPSSYPLQQPSQPPLYNGLADGLTHDVISSISVPLPLMQMDISTSAGVREIDIVEIHQVFHTFLTEHFNSGSLSDAFDYLELDMWSTKTTQLTFIGDIYLFTQDESTTAEKIKANLVTLFSFWGNEGLKVELREAGISVSHIDLHIDGALVVTNDGLLGIHGDETKHSRKRAVLIPAAVLAAAISAVAFLFFLSRSNAFRIDDLSIERSATGATVVVRIGRSTSMHPGSHNASISLDDNGSLSTNYYDSIPVYRYEESANETDSRLLDSVIRSPMSCRYDPNRLDRVISNARIFTGQES